MGTAARMGPAYFPTMLGIVLSLLGAVVALRGLLSKSKNDADSQIEPYHWRVIILILGAVLLFSLCLPYLGLMFSLAVMVATAALADKTSRLKETLILIVVLDVLAYVIFVYGIGLLVPVWPTLNP